MESIQYIAVEALPYRVPLTQGQVEKRQRDFINCVGVDFMMLLPQPQTIPFEAGQDLSAV
jgi:hypothetical protein